MKALPPPLGWLFAALALAAVCATTLAGADDDDRFGKLPKRVRRAHEQRREEAAAAERARILAKVRDNDLHRRLAAARLGAVKLEDVTIKEAIDHIRAEAAAAGVKGFNVVYKCPPERLQGKISMSVENIPVLDLLSYVTQAAHLNYVVEPYAVVIAPRPE